MRGTYRPFNKFIKHFIPLVLILIVVVITYKTIINSSSKQGISDLYKSALQQKEKKLSSSDEKTIYAFAHKMANGLIKADAIWGIIPMTKENVEKIYTVVEHASFPDKENFLSIIDNWKHSDFSNIVNEHNYFWGFLGGTQGVAYGQNKEAVEKAISELKKQARK